MSAATEAPLADRSSRRPVGWSGGLALLVCCWLPVLVTLVRLFASVRDHVFALDFHHYYWESGRAVLEGRSPFPPPVSDAPLLTHLYPAGPYPAPVALLFAPFALLPVWLGDVLFTGVLVASLVLVLRILDVRDWRCYGAVFLWAPVAFALQTANLTLLLALGLAFTWRLRNRAAATALAVGIVLALKLFLWPVVVWLLATRRYAAAAGGLAIAAATSLAAWAALGFAGLQDYPQVARIFARYYETTTYTPFAFLSELGVGETAARAASLVLGITLVCSVVAAARWASEQLSFALAVLTALAWTPIAWLHYFSLLVVALALLCPRFSLAWLLPVVLWVCPVGAPLATWKFALPLVVSAAVLALAHRRFRPESGGVSERTAVGHGLTAA